MEFSKNPLPVLDLCLKFADSFVFFDCPSQWGHLLINDVVIKICQQS